MKLILLISALRASCFQDILKFEQNKLDTIHELRCAVLQCHQQMGMFPHYFLILALDT